MRFNIQRRRFLKNSSAGLAMAFLGDYGLDLFHRPDKWRVGLIGCGWYGKSDLFKLMQVAPGEVSAICDVDRHMLEEAGQLIQDRSDSNSSPRMDEEFRGMLARPELDIVIKIGRAAGGE